MKTVVVLSLARSGSSLLAGILHRLGIYMGSAKDLILGTHVNKYGNYENQDFFKLSAKILYHADCYTIGWAHIPDDEKVKASVERFKDWMKRVIRENERELWGWKDGTSIYTIPYMEKYLTNPYYIVLQRDVESCVRSHLKAAKMSEWWKTVRYMTRYFSLKNLGGMGWGILKTLILRGNFFNNKDLYRQVILDGHSRMDAFVKGRKHINVEFLEVIKKPQETINRIIKFLDITPSPSRLQWALKFIDRDEVHFSKKPVKN
ncbi:MAG: hypothetical protein HWN65_03415 [Candidatus Helarchaeota archaeon]|nr:hypothetical protein [Candidatus Helarchaeota archaeon]